MKIRFRYLGWIVCVAFALPASAQSVPDGAVERLLRSGADAPAGPQSAPSIPASNFTPPNPQVAPGVVVAPVPSSNLPGVSSAKTEQMLKDEAFERALREATPLSPEQILKFRGVQDRARKATVEPLSPGTPISRSLRLTLKPGEATPRLRVQPGLVTTVTFSDITGQPWPVMSVVTGNPSAYVAQSAGPEGKSNIIVVSPTAEHIISNMVVTLINHPVPITIRLDPNESETDYRVDMRIESRGPNAVQEIIGNSSLTPTNDITMGSFLDGTPPDGAVPMKTSSKMVEAWRFEDLLYIRTSGDVMSPAYTGKSSSVSGVNVYVMTECPVVIISADGRMSRVRITR